MEALFKRYFWLVKALGLAGATGLAASAATTAIGSSIVLGDAATTEESGPDSDGDNDDDGEDKGFEVGESPFAPKPSFGVRASASAAAAKERAADQIRKYNIFCPTCLPPDAEPVDPAADGASGVQAGESRSNLPLRLHVTMEAADPALSWASISHTDTGKVGLYRVGHEVLAGVTVVGVDADVVHLRNHASFEYLELGDAAQARRAEPPEPPKPKGKDKKDPSKPNFEDSINCPNESLCIVERSFVEELIANPMQLAKQARISPAKDGEVGFKFYGIRRGSLPRLLGMKNGDKVVAVNGEDLTGIDQVMALYSKLRRASNLSVTIERKGKSINKEIQIQ